MIAIPKGSSLCARDAAMLGMTGVENPACFICGTSPTERHHEPPRSHIPKALQALIPTFSVCGPGNAGGCHALLHRLGGVVRIEPDGDDYVLSIDERAAVHIDRRRALRGLAPLPVGTYRITKGDRCLIHTGAS